MSDESTKNEISDGQARFNRLSARASYISAIAAITGVIVGSIGVFLGWQSLQFTKKIEALRLKPHLTFHGRIGNADGSFLYLKNNGPGAAFIKELKFWNERIERSVDLLAQSNENSADYAGKAIEVILSPTVRNLDEQNPSIAVANYPSDTVLPAGDVMRLLSFSNPNNIDEKILEYVEAAVNNDIGTRYLIKFCSLDELTCDVITEKK